MIIKSHCYDCVMCRITQDTKLCQNLKQNMQDFKLRVGSLKFNVQSRSNNEWDFLTTLQGNGYIIHLQFSYTLTR